MHSQQGGKETVSYMKNSDDAKDIADNQLDDKLSEN